MDKQKQVIIALLLIAASAMALAVFFYGESNKEIVKIDSLKKQIISVTAERINILKDIENLNAQREILDAQIQDYSGKIQNYESDLPKLRSEKEDIALKLLETKRIASALEKKQEDITSHEQALRTELAKAQSGHEDLLEELEYARDEKSELEEKLKSHIQSSKGIELRKIVVKVVKPAEGKIVEVSRQYNFAVVDLGEEDGVRPGDRMEIYRNKKMIARALIENVYDDMSSLVALDQWRNVDLAVGDSVKLQNN
jgi:DNA repair exonuclease SbcCD ATPase subunit